MKNILSLSLLLLFTKTFSQEGFSIGVAPYLSIPTGEYTEFAGVGFGGVANFEYSYNEVYSLTLTSGYVNYSDKERTYSYQDQIWQGGNWQWITRYNSYTIDDYLVPIILTNKFKFGDRGWGPIFYTGVSTGAILTDWDEEDWLGVAPIIGTQFELNMDTFMDLSAQYVFSVIEGKKFQLNISAGINFSVY